LEEGEMGFFIARALIGGGGIGRDNYDVSLFL
jgi:hypothetical protein